MYNTWNMVRSWFFIFSPCPWYFQSGAFHSVDQEGEMIWLNSIWRRKWQPTPVLLPGESQGQEPGGLLSMGLHRVGHNWRDLAAATVSGPKCCFVCFCLNHPNVLVHGLGQKKAVYTADMRKTWVQISALPLSGCMTLGRLFNFYIFLICKNEDNDTYLEELGGLSKKLHKKCQAHSNAVRKKDTCYSQLSMFWTLPYSSLHAFLGLFGYSRGF